MRQVHDLTLTEDAASEEVLLLEDDIAEHVADHASALEKEIMLEHKLGDQVTALEGTKSGVKQWAGVIVEIDYFCQSYIVCCASVPNHPQGYNMLVPFAQASSRLNQPVHSKKRKRMRNRQYDDDYI